MRAPLFILPTNRTGKFSARSSNRRGKIRSKTVQRWLDFEGGSTSYPSDKVAQIVLQAETRRSFSFSARGCGFPAKEMRKAVAGFAGDQPNAMLALSAEERFFLSVLALLSLLQIKLTSGILKQLKSTEDSNEKAVIGHG